ncbi:hypothetical protein Pfo_005515 [Paulownia fortunei]|nr:hypothetical protein Pfo_005515 [Paulownia fortunei]
MGRGKIEIKKIENANSRQVTFSKRRMGLFKKANELAVLCDADVAVIIFSNTGKLFEFASSSMRKILSRYKKCLDATQKQQSKEADVLKEEIEKLKLKQLRLLGKDFSGMGLQELRALEQQLNEGLLCIKERKEQVLVQQLAQSRMQEQRAVLENETLRRQANQAFILCHYEYSLLSCLFVEELRAFFPSTSSPAPLCIEYYSTVKKSNPAINKGSGSPETACNGGLADEDSDTTLHLAPPNGICRKRKTSDGETHSGTSETQIRLR